MLIEKYTIPEEDKCYEYPAVLHECKLGSLLQKEEIS